jgi:integrase
MPARVLAKADVRRLIRHVQTGRYPLRDRATVLLSFRAGLRAAEIAGLRWEMVLRPDGRVDDVVSVARQISKGKRSGRRIPMHVELRAALRMLHKEQGSPITGPVIRSERKRHMRPRSICQWFAARYRALSLAGASSHSGRRVFITEAARLLPKIGASMVDVQELAGHASLSTTEKYVAGCRIAQRRLIRLL